MRIFVVLAFLAALAGCDVPSTPQASLERIAAEAYREPGPDTLTVITMVSNRTGSGGHTALMINGSQRVIFDPAGSFVNERVPERGDVLYGVTPAVFQGYRSAHARSTYHVVTQEIVVTREQADAALRLAMSNGPVARLFCTSATVALLRQVPGFQNIPSTMYPTKLMEQIAARSDVTTDRYFEDDEGGIVEGVAGVEL